MQSLGLSWAHRPAPSPPSAQWSWLPRKDLTGDFLELSHWSSSVIQLPTHLLYLIPQPCFCKAQVPSRCPSPHPALNFSEPSVLCLKTVPFWGYLLLLGGRTGARESTWSPGPTGNRVCCGCQSNHLSLRPPQCFSSSAWLVRRT